MISGIVRYFYDYIEEEYSQRIYIEEEYSQRIYSEEEYSQRIYGAFCEKILQLSVVNKFCKIPHHRCLKGALEKIWIEYLNVNIFFVIFDFK